jgi:hypothetical protein
MPTRTELPTISITWTTTSSPTMIFSPGRLVMMSMKIPPWKTSSVVVWCGALRRRATAALCDQDRRAEVCAEGPQVVAAGRGHLAAAALAWAYSLWRLIDYPES